MRQLSQNYIKLAFLLDYVNTASAEAVTRAAFHVSCGRLRSAIKKMLN